MIAYHESINPEALSGSELDYLLSLGWYRMHQDIFTTSHVFHEEFFRVHWLRYPLVEIRTHRSHERIRRRNQSFRVTIGKTDQIGLEYEALYARYRQSIDFNGAISIGHCLFGDRESGKSIYDTQCISVYDGDQLIAAGYFDLGQESAASILHFFDPNYSSFSLGKYLILKTIDYLKSSGFALYYPGYLVSGDPKMNYKLFLGEEAARYFDPSSGSWEFFNPAILEREDLTDQEKLQVLVALTAF